MPVQVTDPFGVVSDPALPTLALALDPVAVKHAFKRGLPLLAGVNGVVRPKAVRVARYRPGKRCLLEYDVRVERPGQPREKCTLIGKLRARRFGSGDFRLLCRLQEAGFCLDGPDGIGVPRPVGVLPRFRMWLQEKVHGHLASQLLAKPDGVALARRIAEAAYKLHRAGVPTAKRHTMADELHILERCLEAVARVEPRWTRRLQRVLHACGQLASDTPEPRCCGIHRDFYADQVLVDGQRLCLIDFDLYCQGDPGLDIGNFLGHVTEQSLRTLGDPQALCEFEQALAERFIALSGERVRPAVRAYAILTLARHIYLSTRGSERRPWTEPLLELCEQRLGIASRFETVPHARGES